ncbi:MAG: thiol-disulfide oxidoreductase DCC family protein [Ferruginibacter sp.]
MKETPIILFDGVCNLCNGAVNFVIKRDKRSSIKFASLQSGKGHQLMNQYNLRTDVFNSFIFIERGKVHIASTAALKVSKYLSGLWPLLYSFIIVPKFIRDGIYKWIARNRYKWFGKREQCMIPTPEMRSRFLGNTLIP